VNFSCNPFSVGTVYADALCVLVEMMRANEKTIAAPKSAWRGEAATGTGHAVSRASASAER
jgi:hypothetical protein